MIFYKKFSTTRQVCIKILKGFFIAQIPFSNPTGEFLINKTAFVFSYLQKYQNFINFFAKKESLTSVPKDRLDQVDTIYGAKRPENVRITRFLNRIAPHKIKNSKATDAYEAMRENI